MNVAVLGGSHGAYATAADLSLAGHQVRLWRRQERDLAPIRAAGGVSLVAEGRQGLARPERLTTDLAEALADAEVVIIPLPATAHQDLARRLANELSPRQIVLLTPGTFDHRYVTEDAALGLPLYESAGRLANVETPAGRERAPVGVRGDAGP